jgi:hypothetical protein
MLAETFFLCASCSATTARMHECGVVVAWRGDVMILNAILQLSMMTAAAATILDPYGTTMLIPKKPAEALLQNRKEKHPHPSLPYCNSERNAGKISSYYHRKSAVQQALFKV